MLTIEINSFSFKKGYPEDESGNGGGFVFDCRGIENPGRQDEFKKQTGRDKGVQDFLINSTTFPEFISMAEKIVSISIENYLARDFEHLTISFGCTGGQHRSVFAADTMANYIKEKYNCNVVIRHLIQDAKNWINE